MMIQKMKIISYLAEGQLASLGLCSNNVVPNSNSENIQTLTPHKSTPPTISLTQ